MNSIKKQLAINRFAWMFEGNFWNREEIEEAVQSAHIRRLDPSLAENKAKKMVEGYEQKQEEHLPNYLKKGYSENLKIYETRFGGDFEADLEQVLEEIEERDLTNTAKFLTEP